MLEFRVLGPLEVCRDGRPIALPGPASRRLLAALVLRAGKWVSVDQLIDELWGERPPASARKALQMHVARLRAALAASGVDGASVIERGAAGYRILVASEAIDAERFGRAVEAARRALAEAQPERASEVLREALNAWRGAPLAELSLEHKLAGELAQLDEARLAALELRIDADLQLRRSGELIGELRRLTEEYPWRERLRAQLMLALYCNGRQADALAAYRRTREVFVERLGIEPGVALRELERQILAQDPALDIAVAAPARMREPSRPAIPAPPTPTIGRERELDTIVGCLCSDARVVTVTGPGGVGKTRVALEAARRLDATLPDGPRLIELAAIERPAHVLPAIAHVLGLDLPAHESARDGLVRALTARQALLVLDNFEHLVEAAGELADVLAACPHLRLLITSREALRIRGEQRVPVEPLELASATRLFAEIACRHDPAFSPTQHAEAIKTICRRLDGLPLGIELAASRVPAMRPAELAQRLATALSALPDGPRDAPHRQRTLQAAFDWGYDLLDSDEQDTLAAFAVFQGGATLEAAERVTGASLNTLDALITKNLLTRRGTRLLMLETIREYAAKRQRNPHATHRRHLACYLQLAKPPASHLTGKQRALRLARLNAELANFRAALAWGLVHHPDTALALAGALGEFWRLRIRSPEGRNWIRATLDAAGPRAPLQIRARALAAEATLAARDDDVLAARRSAAEGLSLFAAAGDSSGSARCLVILSGADLALGRRRRALAFTEHALPLARRSRDPSLIAHALEAHALATDPLSAALPDIRTALDQLLAHGLEHDAGDLLVRLARYAMRQGEYAFGHALIAMGHRLHGSRTPSWRQDR